MSGAACAGQWELFESTLRADHAQARVICAGCPIRAACADLARETGAAVRLAHGGRGDVIGTWAGQLHSGGRLADEDRMEREEAAFDEQAARQAHARWSRGDRDAEAEMGERVYHRRRARRRRAA